MTEPRAGQPKASDSKPDGKAEPEAEAKAKAKTPSDLTPQIATRAYELFEQHGRHDGQAAQDWAQAEQEIRQDKPDK